MNHAEHKIQAALVQHLRLRQRDGISWFAVPNGGRRDARTGALLKAEGVRAGAPDLHFVIGGQRCECGRKVHGLPFYLELKTRKGSLSRTQKVMQAEIEAAGGIWRLARGIDEALAVLEEMGVIR